VACRRYVALVLALAHARRAAAAAVAATAAQRAVTDLYEQARRLRKRARDCIKSARTLEQEILPATPPRQRRRRRRRRRCRRRRSRCQEIAEQQQQRDEIPPPEEPHPADAAAPPPPSPPLSPVPLVSAEARRVVNAGATPLSPETEDVGQEVHEEARRHRVPEDWQSVDRVALLLFASGRPRQDPVRLAAPICVEEQGEEEEAEQAGAA